MSNQIVKYTLITFPLVSCGLGVWQLRRLEWKKGLITDMEMQMLAPPIDIKLLDPSQNLDHTEYKRVKARGRYDTNPDHQLYLKPRQLIVNDEAVLRGCSAHASNVGVNVITPFQLEGSQRRILVNRGWLAAKGKDNVTDNAQVGLTDALQELTGIMRKSDKRFTYGIRNDETLKEWHILDIPAMAIKLNTEPIFIDLDSDKERQEGPYGGQTHLNIRNEHLNYAITWFSLSLLSFLMWHSKYGRRTLFGRPKAR